MLKCKSCPTHPEIVNSGFDWPDAGICPVCDTLYEIETGVTSEEYRDLAEAAGIDIDKERKKNK